MCMSFLPAPEETKRQWVSDPVTRESSIVLVTKQQKKSVQRNKTTNQSIVNTNTNIL